MDTSRHHKPELEPQDVVLIGNRIRIYLELSERDKARGRTMPFPCTLHIEAPADVVIDVVNKKGKTYE